MAKEVTQEQFDEIKRLLAAADRCRDLSKMDGLSLMKKIALQRQEKALREQAMGIGQ